MLLHDDDEKIKSNIEKFIDVSPEEEKDIRKAWQESRMASNRQFKSCASCGIRDHGNYGEVNVAALTYFFKFKPDDQARFDVLKGEGSLRCCRKVELNRNSCRRRCADGRLWAVEENRYGPFTRHGFTFIEGWNALSFASGTRQCW